jgi:hypothetical protein
MKTKIAIMSALVCATFGAMVCSAQESNKKPLIQMAILLDTSNSMDGLIDQAKSQLWKIVNEFALMKQNGERPELKVALYEYGNDFLSSETGFIRQALPFADDLDKVSEMLFALKTNGGSEYCGTVIKHATEHLAWSSSNNALKVIFIAGNEPFTQGNVDYRKSCPEAIAKGIVVNTIFCGNYEEGVNTSWKDGALKADGKYMNIDQNREVVHIPAPQDTEIEKLGTELNETYVPYGTEGTSYMANQSAQDSNAMSSAKGSFVQRAVTKSSANYHNAAWDLVDALKDGTLKLEDVKNEDLPAEMQKMSLEERRNYIAEKQKEREDIQKQIKALNDQREQFVAEEMKKRGPSKEKTLDEVMIDTIREQASGRQFEVGK